MAELDEQTEGDAPGASREQAAGDLPGGQSARSARADSDSEALFDAWHQSASDLRALTGQMADGVLVCDRVGRVVAINEAARELLGRAADALARVPQGDGNNTGDGDNAGDGEHAGGDHAGGDGDHAGRDGDTGGGAHLPRRADGRPFAPEELPWRVAAAEGHVSRGVEMIVGRGEGRETWLSVNASPLRDRAGRTSGAIAVLRDVTETRRLIEELLEANRRLEEFNRLKAEFVANMSHELRTPLTAIIGFAQLMQMNSGRAAVPLAPQHAEALERILRNGRHLLSLIDDVLDLSKIEVGRISVHPDYVDLVEAVQAAFQELQSLARQKGLEYTLKVSDEFPVAFTDPVRVRQIVINLLSNAIKFTARGRVEAEMTRAGADEWRLVVRDTGVGIKPEALGLIFERFRQVDGSTTRAAGGVGLGLTIVQQIVHLLGGRVDVESEHGRGSTFTVTLPLNAADGNRAELARVVARAAEHAPAPHAVEHPAARADAEGAGAREGLPLVLVVEDDPDAASLLTETLERAGYRVRVAESGEAGIELARRVSPSVITLDIMMPRVDGWAVLRAIRSDARTAQIPVVICSIVDNRPLGYRLGASDYLVKPVSPERLVESLRGVGAAPDEGGGDVLVVDDEQGFRSLVVAALRSAGYAVRSAASGETALRMIARSRPRALMCDLIMPNGMSGFELIARLRSDERTARLPVIAVTAKDVTADDLRLVSGQIADVIRKGDLLMPDLETRLREALEEIGVHPTDGEDSAG
jgi:signal transduction histidine kinase/DNA-binding response OmpR family regulator